MMILGIFESVWSWLAWLFSAIGDLTADAFWDFATWPPTLIAIGLLALAAFLVAHVPLVGKLIPGVDAYQRLAQIVQVAAIAALIFLIGFRVADDRAETERLKNDLAFSEFMLDQQSQLADEADRLKNEADARAADAEGKLNEYEGKFGKVICPPPVNYLDWLHPLQRRANLAGADRGAHQSQRNLVTRLRAAGGQRR